MKTLQDNEELEQVNKTVDGELNEEDIDDEDIKNEYTDDENDETDEEIRNIMSKHEYEPINFEENHCIISENKKKEVVKNVKTRKTIDDCIKEDNALKPTKWSSGRAVNKKKVNSNVDEIKRREFRPRLEPFRNIDKKQFIDNSFELDILQNDACFPDLKTNTTKIN